MSVSYDQGNQYERHEVLELDFDLLGARNIPSYLVKKDALKYTQKEEQLAQNIIEANNSKYNNWGFKEPRMCFTFPFWQRILSDKKYKLILVYRNPVELLTHYKVKKPKHLNQVIQAWRESNLCMLEYIQNLERKEFYIINYNRFIENDDEVDRLSAYVELKCVDLRDKKMYRSKSSSLPFYVVWYYNLFKKKECESIIQELNSLEAGGNKDTYLIH